MAIQIPSVTFQIFEYWLSQLAYEYNVVISLTRKKLYKNLPYVSFALENVCQK